mgnify:CR=1 FL=1
MNTILRTICLAFCLILSVSVITSCKKGTHPPATKPEAQGIGTGGQASTEMEGLAENDLLDNAGKDDFSLMGNQDDEYKKMYGRSTKPLLPIYFYVNKHLVKPYVTGWSDNVMNVQYSKDLRLDGGG